MLLSELVINNFRGIKSLALSLDELVLLIGENNTGKSTILEGIKLALSPAFGRRNWNFSEYDFHLADENACPQNCQPIIIRLHFREQLPDEWDGPIKDQLDEVIGLDLASGLKIIILELEGVFNEDKGTITTAFKFLNNSLQPIPLRSGNPTQILSKFSPVFFLSALRNASDEFAKKGLFWNSFVKTLQIPEDKQSELEEELIKINNEIISSNEGLTHVKEHLGKTGKFVSMSDSVILEALPTRLFDMSGNIQVHLKSMAGVKLPLHRYGEGTQSLAVLMLFQAYTGANLLEAYTPQSSPILTLEEPEAHLHPSASRFLGDFLNELPGQRIVASHSGDLVSRVPITAIRRLYKKNNEVHIGKVNIAAAGATASTLPPGTLDLLPEDQRAIDYHIRYTRGACLFSRCWLLVEGESDFHTALAIGDLLDVTPENTNYSIIEYSQVTQKGEPLIKLARSLGIDWFLLADGDAAGSDYVSRAQKYLSTGELPGQRMHQLASSTIEHEFWNNGFSTFIEGLISSKLKNEAVKEAAGDMTKLALCIIKRAIKCLGGKPAFAICLKDEIRRRGIASIPSSLNDVFASIAQYSRG